MPWQSDKHQWVLGEQVEQQWEAVTILHWAGDYWYPAMKKRETMVPDSTMERTLLLTPKLVPNLC